MGPVKILEHTREELVIQSHQRFLAVVCVAMSIVFVVFPVLAFFEGQHSEEPWLVFVFWLFAPV